MHRSMRMLARCRAGNASGMSTVKSRCPSILSIRVLPPPQVRLIVVGHAICSGGTQKWSVERYKRLLDLTAAPPAALHRIVTNEGDGRAWLVTPDYQRVAAFKKPVVNPKPTACVPLNRA